MSIQDRPKIRCASCHKTMPVTHRNDGSVFTHCFSCDWPRREGEAERAWYARVGREAPPRLSARARAEARWRARQGLSQGSDFEILELPALHRPRKP